MSRNTSTEEKTIKLKTLFLNISTFATLTFGAAQAFEMCGALCYNDKGKANVDKVESYGKSGEICTCKELIAPN
ncbi:MAG TPA: hypothetical protein PLY23_03610 [Alphaproteobacteria bacterium]|nr:hypothetical protein [Alphaproteobacteria bacterium]HQS93877.1 hypothetical protein [Alphaproteobacteria bacterium]